MKTKRTLSEKLADLAYCFRYDGGDGPAYEDCAGHLCDLLELCRQNINPDIGKFGSLTSMVKYYGKNPQPPEVDFSNDLLESNAEIMEKEVRILKAKVYAYEKMSGGIQMLCQGEKIENLAVEAQASIAVQDVSKLTLEWVRLKKKCNLLRAAVKAMEIGIQMQEIAGKEANHLLELAGGTEE